MNWEGIGRIGRVVCTDLLEVHVVEVVLHVLYTGVIISRVKLIRDVPPERPELTSLLQQHNNNMTTT